MSRSIATFGPRLLQVRRAAGLSRPRLARAAGVTEREILALETGTRYDPRLSTVVRLARGLQCTLAELLAPYEERQ